MNRGKLPVSLIVVAVLFIICGVLSVIAVLGALMADRLSINLGVLGLFIGWGLLRLKRGWRTCALVYIWITLICVPLIGVMFIFVDGPLVIRMNGQKIGNVPKAVGLVLAAIIFAITYWEYRVLGRPDIQRLFGIGELQPPDAVESKYLHVGSLVAAGFDKTGQYFLAVSHAGRGVFSVDGWACVARDAGDAYPENGCATGIGPIEGEVIPVKELNYDTEQLHLVSPDGAFNLFYEEGIIKVTNACE